MRGWQARRLAEPQAMASGTHGGFRCGRAQSAKALPTGDRARPVAVGGRDEQPPSKPGCQMPLPVTQDVEQPAQAHRGREAAAAAWRGQSIASECAVARPGAPWCEASRGQRAARGADPSRPGLLLVRRGPVLKLPSAGIRKRAPLMSVSAAASADHSAHEARLPNSGTWGASSGSQSSVFTRDFCRSGFPARTRAPPLDGSPADSTPATRRSLPELARRATSHEISWPLSKDLNRITRTDTAHSGRWSSARA
jgi:hypothetical protein